MSDSPDSDSLKPTPPPSRSPSEALPIELWLLIFQDKGLRYGSYKSLQRVRKDFKKLIESHSLYDRLFRSPPPAQPVKFEDNVAFHPALGYANLVCLSPEDAYVFLAERREDGSKTDFVRDFPCITVYATSPAC
ncbi:hypothetical protein JCM10207_001245 [Rhodosporidiobolus poonsookiae]